MAKRKRKARSEPRAKAGRPLHEPTEKTRQQVMLAAAMGLGIKQTARLLGIADKTLTKHYRDEWETGLTQAVLKCGAHLLTAASKGNITAQIFFLKCKGGWRDGSFGSDLGDKGVSAVTFHISAADARL